MLFLPTMLITDDFIFLNFAKTGTTFVRSIFERIQKRRASRLSARAARFFGRTPQPVFTEHRPERSYGLYGADGVRIATIRDQHAGYRYIPTQLRDRPIVSIARNPFDRLVSTYEFRWWANFTPIKRDQILARFPNYPDLTFAEFVDFDCFVTNELIERPMTLPVGWGVYAFLDMFLINDKSIFKILTDEYITSGRYLEEIAPVRFLRQESLSLDLHRFLLDMGYPAADVDFIRDAERVQPVEGTRRQEYDWRTYYTDDLLVRVRAAYDITFRCYEAGGVPYAADP